MSSKISNSVCKLLETGTHAKATRRQRAILISTIIAAVLALAIFLGALIFVCKRKSKKAHTGETTSTFLWYRIAE